MTVFRTMKPAISPGGRYTSVATRMGRANTAVESSVTACICTAATAARAPPTIRPRMTARTASPELRPIGSTSPTA